MFDEFYMTLATLFPHSWLVPLRWSWMLVKQVKFKGTLSVDNATGDDAAILCWQCARTYSPTVLGSWLIILIKPSKPTSALRVPTESLAIWNWYEPTQGLQNGDCYANIFSWEHWVTFFLVKYLIMDNWYRHFYYRFHCHITHPGVLTFCYTHTH